MAGSTLAVGQFIVDPGSGAPGSVVEFRLALSQAIPGLDSVGLAIGGQAWGDPVEVADGSAWVERTVPDLAPGSYEVILIHQGVTLATADFEITQVIVTGAGEASRQLWLTVPLLAVLLVLGSKTLREVRQNLPEGPRLGPVAAWRVRHGRRPLG
jgi:hypothetical protein